MPTKTTTYHPHSGYYETRDPHQTTTTSYARADSVPRQPHRSRSGDSMPSLNRRPSTTRFAGVPSRSASTDSYPVPPKNAHHQSQAQPHYHYDPSAEPDFASLPPNAFNIMHAWELESLEKWQVRLEQVRKDQKVLKVRIDALRQDEERLWAENARAARAASKPPTTQPQRKRSTSSFTSSESDNEYESALPRRTSNGNLRQQYHPNGPTYYQQRNTRPVEEYGARFGNLYAELAALQEQLAAAAETEDKAKRGIRKATTRLERLRSLEERWKVPSPGNSPPLSRSVSPTPGDAPAGQQQQPQPQQSSRPSSRSPPTSRRNSTDAAAGAGPTPRRPTRTASFTFEFRRGSTATFTSTGNASTKTRGTESSKTSTQYTHVKQPLQPSTRAASIDPWLSYEDRWHQLSTNSSGSSISLRFSSIPWPMAVQPSSPEKITTQAIREFLLNPKAVRASAAKINTSGSNDQAKNAKDEAKARRALLRAALLRWHPDKFLSKFLGWVDESDKAAVKEGVGKVVVCKLSYLFDPLLRDSTHFGYHCVSRSQRDYAHGRRSRTNDAVMNNTYHHVYTLSSLYNIAHTRLSEIRKTRTPRKLLRKNERKSLSRNLNAPTFPPM